MRVYICHQCGITFETYRPKAKFCSLKCKSISHTIEVDFELIRELYEQYFIQSEIAELLGVGIKVIENSFKRNKYQARVAKARPHMRGLNRKKGNLTYTGYHARVYRCRGRANHCCICGETDQAIKYEWANISGNYADINDYESLCRSCHKIYDDIISNILNPGRLNKGKELNALNKLQ